MKPQRHLLLFGSFLCALTNVNAQSIGPSALTAAGNSTSIAGTIQEYAIGQPMSGVTYSSGSLVVTPNVLQPAVATGVNSLPIALSSLNVFPSPMEQTLFLQPSFNAGGTLRYSLFDAAGKLIADEEAKLATGTEQQSIDVTRLAAGQYMLQVQWSQAGNIYSRGYKLQKLR